MNSKLSITNPVSFESVKDFVFRGPEGRSLALPKEWKDLAEKTHRIFLTRLEKGDAIYGVTSGFGDSFHRRISASQSAELQRNLIRYLSCGTGPILRRPVRRAIQLFRLLSLARGLSGVSWELIENLTQLVEADWLPLIPSEGSLGASGDLVPLAYVAQVLQGWGKVETADGIFDTEKYFSEHRRAPYQLKPKEGLALVNGTSAMVGLSYVNLVEAEYLSDLSAIETAWLCLALNGRREAFSELVNEKAKAFAGQKKIASAIRKILTEENFDSEPLSNEKGQHILVQDKYSLRCAPQVLGPVVDTIAMAKQWVEGEINGVSDNPLIDVESENLFSGGNFYGGYLSQSMDYLKISVAHSADLFDRQITLLVDEKSNRGLPANLANWSSIPESERFLHHGLKGLHQSMSAITAEILQKSLSTGIFSRSAESHNQDKVSMGMGAATSCEAQLDQSFRLHALGLICLAQAIDLRGITLRGTVSQDLYHKIRNRVPFVDRDQILDEGIQLLSEDLRREAHGN